MGTKTRKMIVLVSGGRTFDDEQRFNEEFWKFLCVHAKARNIKRKSNVLVIVGDAKGTDALTRKFCERKQIPYKVYEAKWKLHGMAAGPIRNSLMVSKNPDAAFFVWDGVSRGTKDCRDKIGSKIPSTTIYYETEESIEHEKKLKRNYKQTLKKKGLIR